MYVRRLLYVGGSLTFQYHFVGSYGDLQERFLSSPSGGYGPIKDSSGLRLDARLDAIVWRGLTVRLGGYYERYAMSFTLADAGAGYPLPPATDRTTDARAQYLAQSAIDQFYGGSLSLAYQY